ncbi:MAG: glycosyltransferase family 4 protein [Verrucomicrobiales bacterium]|nr:glycosyltransferase family 4 protein [Verrucomicrobiales bacterium]
MSTLGKEMWLFRREEASGGAEIAAKRLVSQFETLDYEVTRVTAGERIGELQVKGDRGPGWLRLVKYANSANRLIAEDSQRISFSLERGIKADIYRAGEGVHLAWLKRKGLAKSLLSFRPLHPVAITLEAITMKAAKCIVANSEMIGAEIKQYYPQCAEKVRVIENGYDPSRFHISDSNNLDPEDTARRLVFAGNGWDRKGLEQALQLLRHLPGEWKLDVLGKGDQSRFEMIAESLKVRDRVKFKGSVADIETYYHNSEALVLPTTYDPFSNACLEAAACGCPVITTNQNGFAALIDHRRNGFILGEDAGSISDCAEWCLTCLPLSKEFVASGVSNYTIEDETRKYREVFAMVAGKDSR